MKIEDRELSSIKPYENNPRINDDTVKGLAASIKDFGFNQPIVLDEKGVIICGHTRYKAAQLLQLEKVPCYVAKNLSEEQVRAYRLLDNRLAEKSQWDQNMLAIELDELQGYSWENYEIDWSELAADTKDLEPAEDISAAEASQSLAARFLVPPFTVLDARQGFWKARREQWLRLGIKSEVGRDANLLGMSETILREGGAGSGTSIFNPVLCELVYRWFSPAEGTILDPFAGGSVRGITAAFLGRSYIGIDVREEQVEANHQQAQALALRGDCAWVHGDSRTAIGNLGGFSADLIFSCPPYGDLEQYSEQADDISNLSFEDFCTAYERIIANACAVLKENRFAVFVVGDFRDKAGIYRNFVSKTIAAFQAAGLQLYNEAVLITPIGSLAMRVGRSFPVSRKLGKCHQNVLVFCKGDPMAAAAACGDISVEGLEGIELEPSDAASDEKQES